MEEWNLGLFAQMIARKLAGWTWGGPRSEDWKDTWHILDGPEGARLNLRHDPYHGRLRIGGHYVRDRGALLPHQEDRPKDITVSSKREPSAVAREIERRFLPAYLTAYRQGVQELSNARAFEQGRDNLATKLAKLCGDEQHRRGFLFSHFSTSSYSIAVRVDGPDRVQVAIDCLTAQKAEEVLKLLVER
jgi:hypothetical protein